jgi:hypothetical protein
VLRDEEDLPRRGQRRLGYADEMCRKATIDELTDPLRTTVQTGACPSTF